MGKYVYKLYLSYEKIKGPPQKILKTATGYRPAYHFVPMNVMYEKIYDTMKHLDS